MSDVSAFKWVEIEGFRGFRERRRIELDASVVIVHGPNGTGKTSFFDALQWLLLGSLQRLEQWRVRRNDEHIVNRYRLSQPAVVEAELQVKGESVRLRRQGSYSTGLLEWEDTEGTCSGDEAEKRLRKALTARPGQDMRKVLMTSALLQQDVVREVLQDKPAERYQQLAVLLGLDELASFNVAARARADRLTRVGQDARGRLQEAVSEVEVLTTQLAELLASRRLADDVRAARDSVVAKLKAVDAVQLVAIPDTSSDAVLLEQAVHRLRDEAMRLVAVHRDIAARRAHAVAPDEAAIASHERAAVEARAELERAEAGYAAAEKALVAARSRSSQMEVLAANALGLLGPTCPVCGQDIDEDHVRQHLQRRIESSMSDAALAKSLADMEAAQAKLNDSRAARDAREHELAPLRAANAEWQQVVQAEQAWMADVPKLGPETGVGVIFVNSLKVASGDVTELENVALGLSALGAGLADLSAVLRTDSGEARITKARAALEKAEGALDDLKSDAQVASANEEAGQTLMRAATRAATAVTDRRFRQLAPIVQDIYQRLDPHPAFTVLDFDLDVYNRKGIASPVVRDEVESVDADPLLVFSSSQANVTALSYFLALGWAAGPEALPFVLLDDPLQSMDDVNSLGFSDLCRHIRRQRQLVVSTHEGRLASLLQRKLAPRVMGERTRVVEFKAWTRHGPEFEQRVVEPQLSEGELRSVVAARAA